MTTAQGEWMTVAEAMFKYKRSRVDLLAIAKDHRDINGDESVPMKKDTGTKRIRALCVSPELDLELRRKK